jgi:hypothetical protein
MKDALGVPIANELPRDLNHATSSKQPSRDPLPKMPCDDALQPEKTLDVLVAL